MIMPRVFLKLGLSLNCICLGLNDICNYLSSVIPRLASSPLQHGVIYFRTASSYHGRLVASRTFGSAAKGHVALRNGPGPVKNGVWCPELAKKKNKARAC